MLRWQVLNLIAESNITELDDLIEQIKSNPNMQSGDQSPSREDVIEMLYLYQDMLPSDLLQQLENEQGFQPD